MFVYVARYHMFTLLVSHVHTFIITFSTCRAPPICVSDQNWIMEMQGYEFAVLYSYCFVLLHLFFVLCF